MKKPSKPLGGKPAIKLPAHIIKRKNTDTILTQSQSRYRYKDGFAKAVKEHSLKTYRKKRGKNFELGGSTVKRSLTFIDDEALVLPVKNIKTGKLSTQKVIRLTILAKLLNTSYQTIWRWSSETGQLPEPILSESTQGRERPVYHLEEARIMVRVVSEHLDQFRYYRKDHNVPKARIFAEIDKLRLTHFGDRTK